MDEFHGPERWLPVPGYAGMYEVSDLGRVRSLPRKVTYRDGHSRTYKGRILRHGGVRYKHVVLCWQGQTRQVSVHRLVLLAFVGKAPSRHEAAHNNGTPGDNRLQNLRWATKESNLADKHAHGTASRGEKSPLARLTEEQVLDIRRLGALGLADKELAAQFGVTRRTIHYIQARKTWAWLT